MPTILVSDSLKLMMRYSPMELTLFKPEILSSATLLLMLRYPGIVVILSRADKLISPWFASILILPPNEETFSSPAKSVGP